MIHQILHHGTAVATSKIVQSQIRPMTPIDFDHLNLLLIRWLINTSLPLTILEDKMLLTSLQLLNPAVKIWSKENAQLAIFNAFGRMRDDVMVSLQNLSSKISISLEFWTSSEQIVFMGVKGFWIDGNWTLSKVLLEVCRISYPHGVQEIYNALLGVLKAFNIEKHILACTLDCSRDTSQPTVNACIALKEELDSGKMMFGHVPCAAHALNLIIEDGLKTIRPALMKIRETVHEINSSSLIGQDFQQLTSVYKEGAWQLPIDSSACWNGDYTMLDIAKKVFILFLGFSFWV